MKSKGNRNILSSEHSRAFAFPWSTLYPRLANAEHHPELIGVYGNRVSAFAYEAVGDVGVTLSSYQRDVSHLIQ